MEDSMKKNIALCIVFLLLTVSAVWSEDRDEALLDAAKSMDVNALREALNSGANLDYRNDALDKTALMIACENQWMPGVKMLVDEGANPSYKNRSGVTALMLAAKTNKNDKILRYIAEHAGDLNPNNQDSQGDTALMYAINNASVSALRVLLEYGANPDAANDDGMDAYMYAVQKGAENHLKILLEGGRAPSWGKTNSTGLNIFMLAATKKKTGMLHTLLSSYNEIDIAKPLPNGELPLAWAMKTGQSTEIIKLIIGKHDADGNIANVKINGKPVVLWAIEKDQPNDIIDRIMRAYDPDVLITEKDRQKRDIKWYIKKYKNSYAQKVLNEIMD